THCATLSEPDHAYINTQVLYQTDSLDFIQQGPGTQRELDEAITSIGFPRKGTQYFHPLARYYVKFPPGPLGIGSDYRIQPVEVVSRGRRLRMLSSTDSCRDRLAGFYHWNDRQGLEVAVRIAARKRVDMEKIRAWSKRENALPRFHVFLEELERFRRRSRRRT